MKNKIFTIFKGLWVTLCLFTMPYLQASDILPIPGIYYYLKIDTVGNPNSIGYLHIGSTHQQELVVDPLKGESALWLFHHVAADTFRLSNKSTGDTLSFAIPVSDDVDTVAILNREGPLNKWHSLFTGGLDSLKTSHETQSYFLSYADDTVRLSQAVSALHAMTIELERPKLLPEEGKKYRIKVDTLGYPYIFPIGFLSADTTRSAQDSLAVSDTLRGDLSLWKFVVKEVKMDTTYYEIRNVKTDSLLAFHIPQSDTVAIPAEDGVLNSWVLPFFVEENGVGRLMVRDENQKCYYLGLRDSCVMLLTNTETYTCLDFVLEEDGYTPPVVQAIVDSTLVYKVKILNGDHAGKYLATSEFGTNARDYLDTVYSHIPNGQFVVYSQNKHTLMNRSRKITTTGKGNSLTDSLSVITYAGRTIATNYEDIFEFIPMTEVNEKDAELGYKRMTPEAQAANAYLFSMFSVDSLKGRLLGYDPVDSMLMLLGESDTMRFVLVYDTTLQIGAPVIADIASLKRDVYSLRSTTDTTLYISIPDLTEPHVTVDTLPKNSYFYLKEDTLPGTYYFVNYRVDTNTSKKLLVNASKYIQQVLLDSVETHSFIIIEQSLDLLAEPDLYEYLTLADLQAGKGYYEFCMMDLIDKKDKWLTKNFYNFAVLGKEGETMLRAGSYTPYDLRLWADTARLTDYRPNVGEPLLQKQSFYFVNNVDTTNAGNQNFSISGYFLHVKKDSLYYNSDSTKYYYLSNFVNAKRSMANRLELTDLGITLDPSEQEIQEYRFYLQKTDENDGAYYIVTEAGLGDGGSTSARGYLSLAVIFQEGIRKQVLYFGDRDGASKVKISRSTVANEVIPPSVPEEINRQVAIIGGKGQVQISHAAGQQVTVFNVLGQQIAQKVLGADQEIIPAPRGLLIVKVGAKTQKVVVK